MPVHPSEPPVVEMLPGAPNIGSFGGMSGTGTVREMPAAPDTPAPTSFDAEPVMSPAVQAALARAQEEQRQREEAERQAQAQAQAQ
ncbi:MAG: hypothetical protein ACXWKW_09545, partial [Asticcacaulis sp.]